MPNMPRKTPEAMTATHLNDVLALVGRIGLTLLFVFSGIAKLRAPEQIIAYIASAGLPAPQIGLMVAIVVEIGCSALLLLGLFTRPAAAAMAAFSLASAAFFHAKLGEQTQFIQFFKNVAIAGGFLQIVAFGAGRLSLDARRSASRG